MTKELDSPAVAAARKQNSQGFSQEEALALQKLLLVPPEVQFQRDQESLNLLLKERVAGSNPLTDVNYSKNPMKVLYKSGTLDDEIARRLLIMQDLQTRISETKAQPKTEAKPTKIIPIEAITSPFYTKLFQLLGAIK